MSIDIDDVNKYDSELDTVIDSLINYLNTSERLGDKIDKFYSEWPEANRGEFDRSISCFTVSSDHNYVQPVLEKIEDISNEAVKVAATYRVGSYNMDLQLDIWCAYKAQRNELYKMFYEIMNEEMLTKDWAPSGLSLKLENYFDTIARYDIVSYNFPDDQRSSQEDEWRARIGLRVHFDKKLQKVQYKITEPIIVDKDQDTGEEYISEHVIIE